MTNDCLEVGLIMGVGKDIMPHRSIYTIGWNQRKTHLSNELAGYKAPIYS